LKGEFADGLGRGETQRGDDEEVWEKKSIQVQFEWGKGLENLSIPLRRLETAARKGKKEICGRSWKE